MTTRAAIVLVAVFTLALHAVGVGQTARTTPLPPQPVGVPWPTLEWAEGPPGPAVDRKRLDAAMEQAFIGPALRGTRAMVVVHGGRIVAERFAPGFDRRSKFISQSVGKFLVGTLVGILVRQGKMDVKAAADVPEWRPRPGDPRARITLENLLHMSSGLQWNESYVDMLSDVPQSMAGDGYRDVAAFVAAKPLAHEPGTHFYYSSGTSNLISALVSRAVGGTRTASLRFMWDELFSPLGMTSAEPEFDAAGTFIGSSWMWATTRDFARLGLLDLRDGVWDGRRILPEGWVAYRRTPGPAPDNRMGYGVQSWLIWPDRGSDAFGHMGYLGQALIVVPSRDLVIARNANIIDGDYGDALGDNLWEIVQAFPPVSPAKDGR